VLVSLLVLFIIFFTDMKNGKYILVVPPKKYKGTLYRGRYAYEHHVVWCLAAGPIPKGFHVHHIDQDTNNNSIDNLCLMSSKAHNAFHASLKKVGMVTLTCSNCEKPFAIEARKYKGKVYSGYSNFYCGRVCMGSKQGKDNAIKKRKCSERTSKEYVLAC